MQLIVQIASFFSADRAQGRDDLWISFQNAAEIATNMYKGKIYVSLFSRRNIALAFYVRLFQLVYNVFEHVIIFVDDILPLFANAKRRSHKVVLHSILSNLDYFSV